MHGYQRTHHAQSCRCCCRIGACRTQSERFKTARHLSRRTQGITAHREEVAQILIAECVEEVYYGAEHVLHGLKPCGKPFKSFGKISSRLLDEVADFVLRVCPAFLQSVVLCRTGIGRERAALAHHVIVELAQAIPPLNCPEHRGKRIPLRQLVLNLVNSLVQGFRAFRRVSNRRRKFPQLLQHVLQRLRTEVIQITEYPSPLLRFLERFPTLVGYLLVKRSNLRIPAFLFFG